MGHRRRVNGTGGGGRVAAVGMLLVLAAAAVLYGAYAFVTRHDAAGDGSAAASSEPGAGGLRGDLEAPPFQEVLVEPDTGTYVMVLDAPWAWTGEEPVARLVEHVERCAAFGREGFDELYPEAKGVPRRIRVVFHHRPTGEALGSLRRYRELDLWLLGPNGMPRPIGWTPAQPVRPVQPAGDADRPPSLEDIDLVLEHPDTHAVILVAVYDEPWGVSLPAALHKKIAAYLRVIANGSLGTRFPRALTEEVTIELHCKSAPTPSALAELRRLRDGLADRSVLFRVLHTAPDQPVREVDLGD